MKTDYWDRVLLRALAMKTTLFERGKFRVEQWSPESDGYALLIQIGTGNGHDVRGPFYTRDLRELRDICIAALAHDREQKKARAK